MTTNRIKDQELRLREVISVAAEAWECARGMWSTEDLDLVILVINTMGGAKQLVRVVDRQKLIEEYATKPMPELQGIEFSIAPFEHRTAKMAMTMVVSDAQNYPNRDFVWVIILEQGYQTVYTTIMPPTSSPPLCNAKGGQA